MADRADDDVLDLKDDDQLEEQDTNSDDEDQDEDGEQAGDEDDDEDGDPSDEEVPGFGDEAAPASEGDNSVIRDMRQKLREKERRIAELERSQQPKAIEVGEKPTLESCEYDEERFETELDAWKSRKAKAEQQEAQVKERTERERAAWTERAKAYERDKQRVNVSDYDKAESEVFTTLADETQALIMLTEKPAALIYALSRNPAKLEELSKLDLARAAMLIGKLEDKLTMTKRTSVTPDRAVKGNAQRGGKADKELERLEKEADRTGDRTKLIAYRRKAKSQG